MSKMLARSRGDCGAVARNGMLEAGDGASDWSKDYRGGGAARRTDGFGRLCCRAGYEL